ncbi:3-oxoadipate enol-lactonase [Actinomadura craniellae]|uniref:3-oxoadipate enol-lactonase n=1 Tax=Actinomadura craniellae TaxID=2231787 RepID=UPI001F1B3052|nr:3-oxoadipate enol-lactonase [Actinomadura craniellae]
MTSPSPQRPARLHHRVDGPDGAPVLVLGPSLGSTLELWDPQLPVLAESWRVIRYDLRGHGGSEVVPGPATLADLAGDVLALLDGLGVERFAAAGISLGGAISVTLALAVPDRVGALAMCCSAARFGEPAMWHDRAAAVRAQGMDGIAEGARGRWFTPAADPAVADAAIAMIRGIDPEGYATCCEALADYDVTADLPAVAAPTLVLAGAADPAVPEPVARALAGGIPGARLTVLPGAAHLANLERPVEFTAALAAHLGEYWK